jgi:hypothetical protein
MLPLFSYVFHPIFISVYGVVLYLWISEATLFSSIAFLLLIQVSILTLLLPISIFFLLKAIGNVKSFTEATIRERRFPIFLQALFLLLLISFSGFIKEELVLYYFFSGGIISSIVALSATFLNFKISLHMIGIASLFAFIINLSIYYSLNTINILAVVIVLMGHVASSRLYMKSHNVVELFAGTLLGIISQFVLCPLYL